MLKSSTQTFIEMSKEFNKRITDAILERTAGKGRQKADDELTMYFNPF